MHWAKLLVILLLQTIFTSAFPRDQRGPYCYTCDFMTDPTNCDKVKICPRNQQCSLYVPEEFKMNPNLLYNVGCQTNLSCNTLGHTYSNTVCPAVCCGDDFCNTACGKPATTLQPTTIEEPACHGTGYVSLHVSHTHGQMMCIRVVQGQKTWDDARATCKRENADLLVLDSGEKISAVKNYLHVQSGIPALRLWLGINTHNHKLTWVNGQEVLNWKGDVSDPGHVGNCVVMNRQDNLHWNHVSCDGHHPFVCEQKV